MLNQQKSYRVWLSVLALVISLVWPVYPAQATEADAEFDADTNVTVTVEGKTVTFVIASGSQADTFEVSTSTLTVTVGTGGDTFTVKDTDATRRMQFTIDGDLSPVTTCAEDQSLVTLSNSATTTYAVQPQPNSLCVATGTPSGGGGGGGGGASPAPTPAPSPEPSPAPSPTPSATPVQPPSGAHANGTLILDQDTGTIFLVVNGKKRGFRTPEEYKSHGYEFAQAVFANTVDLGLQDDEQAIEKAMDGTLVLDKTDNRTIYMVAGGQKRGFTSAEIFFALGYQFDQAIPIDLSDYPAAAPITSGAEAHPNGALVLDKTDNRTVWWILDGRRRGFQSVQVFETYGFSFEMIVPASDADMALPAGALVKFRDGTLVKDGDDYYLISDGLKRKLDSLNTLISLGYKTENAIVASLADYEAGAIIKIE